VESNHHSLGPRGYSALGSPVPGIRTNEGRPAGFEPTLRDSQSRVLADYTTVTKKSGDDRTRTGDLSPDKRLL
jgi:hypothetical protein